MSSYESPLLQGLVEEEGTRDILKCFVYKLD